MTETESSSYKHAVITSMCIGACAGAISWIVYQMMRMDERLVEVEGQLALATSACAKACDTNYAEFQAPAAVAPPVVVDDDDDAEEEEEEEEDEPPPPPSEESEEEDMPP